jgi:hypothetical protein
MFCLENIFYNFVALLLGGLAQLARASRSQIGKVIGSTAKFVPEYVLKQFLGD